MKKQKSIYLMAGIMLCTLVVFGCIGIKTEIWIFNDGSGELQVEYRIPKVLIDGLKESENSGIIAVQDGIEIPGQFTEYGIREEIEDLESLTLTGYKVRRQGKDVFIFYKIEFSDFEELYDFDLIPEINIEQDGDRYLFEQDVCSESGLDTEDAEVIRVYKDYKNTFIVHAPKRISSFNRGQISEDKSTLIFEYNLLEADQCMTFKGQERDDVLRAEW
ncbi:MAG: hypothetical protein JW822_13235 [Spirochaetales bacterium]|nr:hypothetical protein [Spirochaetales bacterium]